MITFVVHLRVRPGKAAAFEAVLAEVVRLTRAHEPGVEYYDFAASADEPECYVVIEVYRDAQAHAAHMAQPWITRSLAAMADLLDGPPQIRRYIRD